MTFITVCNVQDIDPGDDEGGEHMVMAKASKSSKRPAQKASKAAAKRIDALTIAPRAHVPVCMNSVAVALNQPTTAGLEISEVTFGTDTFATQIPVGGQVQWDETCDPEDCEPKVGSAKVVDAATKALVAIVGGFKVCRCKI